MAGKLTNAAKERFLNYEIRLNQDVTRSTAIYAGLATAAITEGSTLATITEPTDSTYARQLVYNSAGTTAKFAASSDVTGVWTTASNAAITFPFATGGVEITYGFLCNLETGSTGGLLISFGSLATAKTPDAGGDLTVNTGNFTVGID